MKILKFSKTWWKVVLCGRKQHRYINILHSNSPLKILTTVTYMSSWRSSKEGDLPLCILEKREILRKAIPWHLFHPSTFKFRLQFWKWWDISYFEWLKTLYIIQNIVVLYLVDTLLTKQCIFIGKFNTIHSF